MRPDAKYASPGSNSTTHDNCPSCTPWYVSLTSPLGTSSLPLSFIPTSWPLYEPPPPNTAWLRFATIYANFESKDTGGKTAQIAPLSPLPTGLLHLPGVSPSFVVLWGYWRGVVASRFSGAETSLRPSSSKRKAEPFASRTPLRCAVAWRGQAVAIIAKKCPRFKYRATTAAEP
jgi:hypothetical protein